MSFASERDLYTRSLGGDWQARVDLYQKYFHGNPRVRRLGFRYPDLDDFLQDSFANTLRSNHVFSRGIRLGDRVEAVARWTALERERLRETDSSGAASFVRMCAAVEGDESGQRARIGSYVPPSTPEDSLPSRISAILGEIPFNLVRVRATGEANWAEAAAAAGRPVNTIGPFAVRAVDRLARFFGAPPLLNADLEPVFSAVSAADAGARLANPSKPRGRAISMQLDPAFYVITPEMRSTGLSVPSEVRTMTLWDAARASTPPGELLRDHLARCRYCAEVLRALLLMQQALRSQANADFLVCPGASTLLQNSDGLANDALRHHLADCPFCAGERTRTLGVEEVPAATAESKLRKEIAWAVAAAVIACILSILGIHYFSSGRPSVSQPLVSDAVPDLPPVNLNSRYADLAQNVVVDDQRLFASVLPADQLVMLEAVKDLKGGRRLDAKKIAARLANQFQDPGAQMLYAECLYMENAVPEGYFEIRKAEAMSPRDSFRCWTTLQCALKAGDLATVHREIEHLSSDPQYAPGAKATLAKLLAAH